MNTKITVVTPVYNEAPNIDRFLARVEPILSGLTTDYEIVFALDPSRDDSEVILERAHARDARIKTIVFSRRFGQPMATLAGLHFSTGDAVIVMDVDLQDPPEIIPEMVQRWKEGFEVVYAQRRSREATSWIYKGLTAVGYRLINWLSEDVSIPPDTGDFRLLGRRAVDELLKLKESHGFLRGMVALVGFRQTAVFYDRPGRVAGQSHYNKYVGSLKIALNGFVCFSNQLLRLTTLLGFITAGMAFLLGVIYIALKLRGIPFPIGNPTVVSLVLFLGGVQLVSVGILGEYIGRIYDEVKQRPHFIVDRKIGFPV